MTTEPDDTKQEESPSSPSKGDGGLFHKAYGVRTPDDNTSLYRNWAQTYDAEVSGLDYAGPAQTVTIFQKHVKPLTSGLTIIDAGCGTGMVAEELRKQMKEGTTVDGMDLSQEMIDVARSKNIYRDLKQVDLTAPPIDYPDNTYDACICVGTFTHGHVPPTALKELIRIVKPGGIIIFTVHEEVWESEAYNTYLYKDLKELCKVVHIYNVPYIVKYKSFTVVLETI